ncbi:aminoglycoside phosphotransferase (APT) family kinase protein [Arthrobacter sp. V4I6]|uniref:aminoglycoside phosphotransferase family protein n=1 Tax=unclassified Arthrobacter TaxID=235627 RepID=UPI002781BAB7|nr:MULTISPECIES: aminoglycoside phosphotransferase family protein [unclassified Arthrobacter]MDQ0819333.1 aminoglycoside phosphotransferase (APT) family kinase protein [Arthrobacter sp. V1I7]MDQ0853516.1 aminoglycoside phosphotransferase (APT) family kinase protein [Arthrobacter sp. V4I6]
MSTALQGQGQEGQGQAGQGQAGQRLDAQRREADRALAARDSRIPALNWVLDDELLSELLGESVRITRTRYKPGTSVLVAFRRGTGDGAETFGWASTTTAEHVGKLQRRAASSQGHGVGIRLIQPDQLDPGAVVAVGRIEEDWPLRANLRWLRDHGLGRLGALGAPGAAPEHFLASPASVLRYNPERRLVVRVPSGTRSVVVRTAAQPDEEAAGLRLRQRLASHGVPVLPELADAECARHGISASPGWGDGDLSGWNNDAAAFRAGEALAMLHRIQPGPDADPAEEVGSLVRQLAATRSMIAQLLPGLEAPLSALANRLLAKTCTTGPRGLQSVLVHGDFSADQILVDGAAVRIIDFDRVRTADPAMDLGSFAAVQEIAGPAETGALAGAQAGGRKTAQLIDGYRQAGGRVSQTGVDTWAAFRLFLNSVDPFRNRASDWPADTNWHIRRALELIA